jgi:MFS transporter, AAHS family, 4-hydroxybenzoate transporter
MGINPGATADLQIPERLPAPIELNELIDRRPMSAAQVMVAVLCAAALFVDGYDIQVMALAVPSLAAGWSLPPSSFGLALSAVVIGISMGSGLLGPFGDRIGRRTMLTITMVAIGIATACTALATTPDQFVIWRFLTGVALGAGIPSCAALTSEYAPVANRSLVMGLMNIASPVGAFSAGFIAPPVLEAFGWRGAFVIGGVAPLVLAGLAMLAPESLKFLIVRRPSDPRIARILRRVAPNVDPSSVRVQPVAERAKGSWLGPVARAFLPRTVLLWGLLILNLFNLYVLISWLPTLLEQSGWSPAAALRGAVLIQAGGVGGGLLMAHVMDRGFTKPALVGGFLLSAASLALFALLPIGAAWVALLLLTGAGISGSQLSLNALSAAYYPPAIKATGVAWALVIGMLGAIAGPLAGARLIELHLTPVVILALLAIPSIVCALGVALMRKEWQAH